MSYSHSAVFSYTCVLVYRRLMQTGGGGVGNRDRCKKTSSQPLLSTEMLAVAFIEDFSSHCSLLVLWVEPLIFQEKVNIYTSTGYVLLALLQTFLVHTYMYLGS